MASLGLQKVQFRTSKGSRASHSQLLSLEISSQKAVVGASIQTPLREQLNVNGLRGEISDFGDIRVDVQMSVHTSLAGFRAPHGVDTGLSRGASPGGPWVFL